MCRNCAKFARGCSCTILIEYFGGGGGGLARMCLHKLWRVPNPSLANPLVAEWAFHASEYWGLTRVSEVHGKWQESVGISNTPLTPAPPRFVDRQGALSATPGLAKGGLGTHQKLCTFFRQDFFVLFNKTKLYSKLSTPAPPPPKKASCCLTTPPRHKTNSILYRKACSKFMNEFLREYHPFQNHYTHEIIIFELFRGLQLQLSGVFRNNLHCSYSFLVFLWVCSYRK